MAQDFSNYINTYKGSSVLQQQFPNMNDYLALFGYNQGTTPSSATTSTATTTTTPVTSTAPNIINQNINQGGGGGDGPPGPTPTGTKTYGKTFTGMTMPDGTPIGSSGVVSGPGFLEGLLSIPGQLMEAYTQFSPLGFIGRKMEANKVAKQKAIDDAIAKSEAARKMREAEALAKQIGPGLASLTTQGGGGGVAQATSGAQAAAMGGGSRQAKSSGSMSTGRTDGGWGWKEGGSVKKKKGKSLLDFIDIKASGSKSGKQQIQGAPEGITMDNESINAIVKADIPLSEKIDLLASYGYGKDRSKVEKDNEELFLGEGGYKDRNIGLGFNKDGEGIGGTLMYNIETGEPEVKLKFVKNFKKGGLATMFKLKG
jgi:hypothetical protein